jgi:hypothetical protein
MRRVSPRKMRSLCLVLRCSSVSNRTELASHGTERLTVIGKDRFGFHHVIKVEPPLRPTTNGGNR